MQANELFTQPNTILLDGGMGTMLQASGLKPSVIGKVVKGNGVTLQF